MLQRERSIKPLIAFEAHEFDFHGAEPARGEVSKLEVVHLCRQWVKIGYMSATEVHPETAAFSYAGTGLQKEDEAPSESGPEPASATYYAGASRRARPAAEVVKAVILVLVILVVAVVATRSVESKVCQTSISDSVACEGVEQ